MADDEQKQTSYFAREYCRDSLLQSELLPLAPAFSSCTSVPFESSNESTENRYQRTSRIRDPPIMLNYGLDRNSLSLILTYLSNRIQRVKVGTCLSKYGKIKIGVPQGSVLDFCFSTYT